jgi:hypothetical protein
MKAQGLLGAAVLAAVSFAVTSCATIVSGSTQSVKFRSNPPGAHVVMEPPYLDAKKKEETFTTPNEKALSRKSAYKVVFEKPGYKSVTRYIQNGEMNGWVWGNILFGGLIGILVDWSTGAMNSLDPVELTVNLEPVGRDALP